ncbi:MULTISPECIES: HAD family hydrolase [Frankia]|nr:MULTISPECIES: HAD family hydrolase [Frankia]
MPLTDHLWPPDPAMAARLRGEARERWGAGPHHGYCRQVGISSWEGLWLDPDLAAGPPGFAAWIIRYQRQVRAPYDDANTLAEEYRSLRAEFATPYPDVPEALRRLGIDHEIWVVTNGDGEVQRRKLRLSGLDVLADRVFVSADIGAAKPDPASYAAAEEALAASALRVALVIGDSATKDLAPALERGWPLLGVRRSPASSAAPDRGVTWIPDLSGIAPKRGPQRVVNQQLDASFLIGRVSKRS